MNFKEQVKRVTQKLVSSKKNNTSTINTNIRQSYVARKNGTAQIAQSAPEPDMHTGFVSKLKAVKNKRNLLTMAGAGVLTLAAVFATVAIFSDTAVGASSNRPGQVNAMLTEVNTATLPGVNDVPAAQPAQQDPESVDSAPVADASGDEDAQGNNDGGEQEERVSEEPAAEFFETGDTDPKILEVQKILMELGYMDFDEPSDTYTEDVEEAVSVFQSKNGLTVDGFAGEETLNKLFSGDSEIFMISVGEDSTEVYELQVRLHELGYMDNASSYFGTETEAAVMAFQQTNSLTTDGKVGPETREMLYSSDAKAKVYEHGEEDPMILTYQYKLKDLGYLTTDPDGKYGDDTHAAVQRFQEKNGLIADGHLGPTTAQMLMSESAQPNSLKLGNNGDDVSSVQQMLTDLGYMSEATGYFGSVTEKAVMDFQEANSLDVDGKVGAQTMSALVWGDATAGDSDNDYSSDDSSYEYSERDDEDDRDDEDEDAPSANISGANADSLVSVAQSKLGSDYSRGAKGPGSFDCSGFVYWCLNEIGIDQGYMTSYAWRTTDNYTRLDSLDDVRKGDIIVFKMSSSSGHVGIAISDDTMVDASSSNDAVVQRSFKTDYWYDTFYCAYRIF